jgi:hypothetical protein
MENNIENIKANSFVDGLKDFFTKGSLVNPVRLNKRMKEIIILLIEEDLENTVILFPEEDSSRYENFMCSMTWLKQKISGNNEHNISFNKKIGATLYFWINSKKYHYLSGDDNFEKGLQWILNHINKKWSISELANE